MPRRRVILRQDFWRSNRRGLRIRAFQNAPREEPVPFASIPDDARPGPRTALRNSSEPDAHARRKLGLPQSSGVVEQAETRFRRHVFPRIEAHAPDSLDMNLHARPEIRAEFSRAIK